MKKVRIADYANGDGALRDRTFEDCEIIGPVALVAVGGDNRIIDCGDGEAGGSDRPI